MTRDERGIYTRGELRKRGSGIDKMTRKFAARPPYPSPLYIREAIVDSRRILMHPLRKITTEAADAVASRDSARQKKQAPEGTSRTLPLPDAEG